MPLRTASHSLTRRTTKDGRKRTLSTVSNTTTTTQAGPGDASKHGEKGSSGPNKALKSQKPAEPPVEAIAEPTKKVPDVFQFLDENDDSSSESSSSSESESSDYEAPPVSAQSVAKIQSPKPRTNPTSHALLAETNTSPKAPTIPISAIPSRSPSDSRPPPPAPSAPAPTANQWQVTRKQPPKSSATGFYDTSEAETSPLPAKRQLQISRPESYYTSSRDMVHRPSLPPSPPSSPEDSIHRGTPSKRRSSSASQISSGYGVVASHLTHSAKEEKAGFPPLYRRFGAVNHRVLLYLQDEISQMEEDLQALDEYEEMHRVATAEKEGTKPMPASRRMDVQSQAYSSLHYRRMELMAALTQKIEQYNNALSSYSKVLQTLPLASEDDIQNYRSWMKAHNPIAAAETRFLDQDADLLSLAPRLAASAAAAPVYMAIFIASGALLLPLLAFSMIAEFSGRLVVVTVTGGAAAAIAANYSAGIDTLVDSRDGWRCTMLYFGFMTIAAMFIP
ncbi:hypothetical protein N7532_004190 [Penicillium argentinense]|uniref:DUF6594 domain-containing protein n=1 Tax=Penicillium argentinense TaxID=1131581 RepID=A0A9W9FNW6_9EURO|nr:uncharacterized protein N7532_004190 [Penicillium argentinense]KAJ5103661.1 hypothetical protein N7532_004190 [Penicillium argentinense]